MMSRKRPARETTGSSRPLPVTARLLASACSCAQRLQVSLEGLGGASNILLLVGVGANFAASYLSGLSTNSGLHLSSKERLRQLGSQFGDGPPIGADLP
jgi:hypothetical protein